MEICLLTQKYRNIHTKSRKDIFFFLKNWITNDFALKELSPFSFSVQQDNYDGEIIEASEDFVHGNFEVVPGVSADEYIQRFQKGLYVV